MAIFEVYARKRVPTHNARPYKSICKAMQLGHMRIIFSLNISCPYKL